MREDNLRSTILLEIEDLMKDLENEDPGPKRTLKILKLLLVLSNHITLGLDTALSNLEDSEG